jgi:hypothetical protein
MKEVISREGEDQRQRRRRDHERLNPTAEEFRAKEVISVKVKTNVKGGGVLVGD